tara:strand:+ start:8884 stop:9201 length:318 start_codon:yes stop_codon:yes gene_type:complete
MFLHFRHKGSLKTFIIALGVLILFIYTSSISLRNLLRYNMFKKELIDSQRILDKQQLINKQYQEKIALMLTDDYWMLEAKKKLGYIQSDEYIYKFYSSERNMNDY